MYRLLLVLLVLCQGFWAQSATVTWDGSASDDWDTPANWTPTGVPGSTDEVIIPDCTGLSNCPTLTGNLTVDSGGSLTIESGGTLTVTGTSTINGSLTVDNGGSWNATDDVNVGTTDDSATFTNNGTSTLGAKLKAEGSSTGWTPPTGPYIVNTSILDVDSEVNVGNGGGGGSLTNSGTITTKQAHIDGYTNNSGTINATVKLKMHGGLVEGGGTINTPLVEFDNNGGRAGTFADQNVSDGMGCSGSESGGVEYELKDGNICDGTPACTFQDLVDVFGDSDTTSGNGEYYISDPGNFTSCGTSGTVALPVELLYFTGLSNNGSVELSWSTATEINNDHFEIEKSTDGSLFSIIGEVHGNGTTNNVIKYSFIDANSTGFENYYRLKQVDYDGQHEYFNIIAVQTTGSSGIKIYPNPTSANSALVVQVNNALEPDLVSVELTDISGRILQKKLGYENSFELSTKNLVKGTYLVRVSINSIVQTSKVLVD